MNKVGSDYKKVHGYGKGDDRTDIGNKSTKEDADTKHSGNVETNMKNLHKIDKGPKMIPIRRLIPNKNERTTFVRAMY